MASMMVNVSGDGKTVLIKLGDRFDFSIHREFRETFRYRDTQGITFEVNLNNIIEIDSAALGMLLLLKQHAESLGGKVVLSQLKPRIRRVLLIAKFDQQFTFL